jgi:CotS family spore coat protein
METGLITMQPGADGGSAMQGLEREITQYFGIDVKSIFPYKDAFIAVTAAGRKLVRRVLFSPERLKFVHGAKEHLASNGFTGIDRYIVSLSGEPGFCHNDCLYAMTDYKECRESCFDDDEDVKKAAEALADLHRASAGYRAPEGSKVRDDLGKLPAYFTKRLNDIRKMRKQAKRGKRRFDHVFQRHADYFISMGENALHRLSLSDYEGLAARAAAEKSFCHHDYTHHNILVDGGSVIVTNFDYCCYELRTYDVANLIRRKMRRSGWDISKAAMICEAYSRISTLSTGEMEIIRIMLEFPQKFWRVANRYYNSRRSWSEKIFLGRLEEVINETRPLETFLKAYDRVFL